MSSQRQRLEQWLENPKCEKNTASAVFGIPLEAASDADNAGAKAARGITKIASKTGEDFEHSLFSNDFLLSDLLVAAQMVDEDHRRVDVSKIERNSTVKEHLDRSAENLREIASGKGRHWWLINGFRLPATIFQDEEATFEADIVLARPIYEGNVFKDKYELLVGEVKVYPAMGGRTSSSKLSSARGQAGLYVKILRDFIVQLGLQDKLEVSSEGFLVFTDPVDGTPVLLQKEQLRDQATRANLAIEGLSRLGDRYRETVEQKAAYIEAAKHEFKESCWSFCALAKTCFLKEVSLQNPIVLGHKAAKELNAMQLERVLSLARGELAPESGAEYDLLQRLDDSQFPELKDLKWK